ncbi:hypothetical protein MAA_11590 [Metarhizium robertsii ARSEF 23]|uniref:RING-type domain-containing protein n=1 Tax=Metarhizium robertsii (strain ARSEF 23 / ATCC MYA-3075) TaxID=655844 RepID=A0A0B2XFM4_METRA|nr:uncharacterized protein MAA_11590 [Metarhizium robertsii ARSEF 23]KHO10829.1 hypothetical protein MAA_11590 [Metarhizium robertsii ARSEF 23]
MSQPSVPSDWPGTPPTDTPAPSTDASRTSGLASGLCIALAIIIGLTVYVLRGRIFPLGAHTAATPPRRSDTLAPEALALLPTHTHDYDACLAETSSVGGAAPGPNDRCCSVCTEPFMHGVQLRRLPCGHQFDRACIDPWLLGRSATCPLCRQKVTTRPLKMHEKLPMSPRPTFFPPSRWRRDGNSSRVEWTFSVGETPRLTALQGPPGSSVVANTRRVWHAGQTTRGQRRAPGFRPSGALTTVSESSTAETREMVENRG